MKKQSGFSLIELMIALAIVGILAAIAFPSFRAYQVKTKRTEAKTLLLGIFDAEQASFAESHRYSVTESVIGFAPAGAPKYFLTRGIGKEAASFTATTSANFDGDADREVWQITLGDRQPVAVSSDL